MCLSTHATIRVLVAFVVGCSAFLSCFITNPSFLVRRARSKDLLADLRWHHEIVHTQVHDVGIEDDRKGHPNKLCHCGE